MLNKISLNIGLKLTNTGKPGQIVYNRSAQILGETATLFSSKYEVGKVRRQINTLGAVNFFRQNPSQNSYTPLFSQVYPQSLRDRISVEKLINYYDAFLIDIRGVVSTKTCAIKNTLNTIKEIQRQGKNFIFISNISDISSKTLSQEFSDYGFNVLPEQIVTSDMVLKTYFAEKGLVGQPVILIGGLVAEKSVREAGAIPLDSQNIMKTYGEAKAVVIADFDEIDIKINAAINALRRQKIPCVLINPDEIYSLSETEIGLAAGSVGLWIERYTGKKIDKLGKPYRPLFEFALSKLNGIAKEKILVIGDTLEHDILGAINVGLDSLLVLSGIDGMPGKIENLEKRMLKTQIFPIYVLPSIARGEK